MFFILLFLQASCPFFSSSFFVQQNLFEKYISIEWKSKYSNYIDYQLNFIILNISSQYSTREEDLTESTFSIRIKK